MSRRKFFSLESLFFYWGFEPRITNFGMNNNISRTSPYERRKFWIEYERKRWRNKNNLPATRGVDVKKRTVTMHSYSVLQGIRFGHYMSCCLFSFSYIGHILDSIQICHNWVNVLKFLVTFLLLTTNTALCLQATKKDGRNDTRKSSPPLRLQGVTLILQFWKVYLSWFPAFLESIFLIT